MPRSVIIGQNDLASQCPDVAKQWHPTKNGSLKPTDVAVKSQKKAWWFDERCGHEWSAVIYSRTCGCGCPICADESHTSFAEQAIYYYVKQFFSDVVNRDHTFDHELDIYIPSLAVAIEYDGYYHNEDRIQADLNRIDYFKAHGVRLICVREKSCAVLPDVHDVIIRNGSGDMSSLNIVIKQILDVLGVVDADVDVRRDSVFILGQYIVKPKEDSLADVYPELAKEWHPTKNGVLDPTFFRADSGFRVWWQCDRGHSWIASIDSRVRGTGCPYCSNKYVWLGFNDLASQCPEIAKEWHPTKNGKLTPSDVTIGSNRRVWWLCKDGHEWCCSVAHRVKDGTGCPYDSGNKIEQGFNDLAFVCPDLAREWHPVKNDRQPTQVTASSRYNAWWQCEHGHEWQTTVNSRYSNGRVQRGCPFCSGKRVTIKTNDLATTDPDLAKEWHVGKNGDLKPTDVSRGSNKRVWWQCHVCGHEWSTKVSNRTCNHRGCPKCARKAATAARLLTMQRKKQMKE